MIDLDINVKQQDHQGLVHTYKYINLLLLLF